MEHEISRDGHTYEQISREPRRRCPEIQLLNCKQGIGRWVTLMSIFLTISLLSSTKFWSFLIHSHSFKSFKKLHTIPTLAPPLQSILSLYLLHFNYVLTLFCLLSHLPTTTLFCSFFLLSQFLFILPLFPVVCGCI